MKLLGKMILCTLKGWFNMQSTENTHTQIIQMNYVRIFMVGSVLVIKVGTGNASPFLFITRHSVVR